MDDVAINLTVQKEEKKKVEVIFLISVVDVIKLFWRKYGKSRFPP